MGHSRPVRRNISGERQTSPPHNRQKLVALGVLVRRMPCPLTPLIATLEALMR